MNFDAVFSSILPNPEKNRLKRQKDREEQLRRDIDRISKYIRQAHVNGASSCRIEPNETLSQEVRDALGVYCTIKEIREYNRTEDTHVFYGWHISWQ